MTELLLRILLGATLGLALVLVLRRPARRLFGAGPAFTLWLLPIALMLAPLLPRQFAPMAMIVLPGLTVKPEVAWRRSRRHSTGRTCCLRCGLRDRPSRCCG